MRTTARRLFWATGLSGLLYAGSAQAQVSCSPGIVSRFWERLDALCTQVEALRAATITDPARAKARDELVTYCGAVGAPAQRPSPEFAAQREQDRIATLVGLGELAGAPPSAAEWVSQVAVQPSTLLRDAAERLVPANQLRTGAATNPALRSFVKLLCGGPRGIEEYLPHACSPLTGPEPPLVELRDRLVFDLAELPRSKLRDVADRPEAHHALRVTLAVIDSAVEALDLYQLVRSLARDTVQDVRDLRRNPCAGLDPDLRWARPLAAGELRPAPATETNEGASAGAKSLAFVAPTLGQQATPLPLAQPLPPAAAGDVPGMAARLIERLLQDGPQLDRAPEHYVRLLLAALQENGLPAGDQVVTLSPLRRAAAEKLVADVRRAQQLRDQLAKSPTDPALLEAMLGAMVGAVEAAMTLVVDQPWTLPGSTLPLLGALAAGDLQRVIASAADVVREVSPSAAIDRKSMHSLDCALSFVTAEDARARQRSLRACLIAPWSEPILFDGNAGARWEPKTGKGFGTFRLLLGYSAARWGVAAEGEYYGYELSSTGQFQKFANGRRGWGTADVWLTSAPRALRLDGRLSLGGGGTWESRYVSSAIPLFDEDSYFGNLTALVGARYEASRAAAGLWLGGGGSYEHYEPFTVTQREGVDISAVDTLQGTARGRLRATAYVVPTVLAVRALADFDHYRFTRIRNSILTSASQGASVTSDRQRESVANVDVNVRGFIDLEAARFAGFVPGVGGGFDYVWTKREDGVSSDVAPVILGGVRRESF